MKIKTLSQLTLDGVTQANGGNSAEDLAGGFDRGGWALGAGDDATRDHIFASYEQADAFLFGRRTYELFLESWGSTDEMKQHRVGKALDEKPKYVASTTLTNPTWVRSSVLGPDLYKAITELKASGDGELVVPGSSRLIQWLLENDLVDELELLVVPVVLGQGRRLFADSGRQVPMQLVDSTVDTKGVAINTYRPVR